MAERWRKRKQLRIPLHETKLKENSHNSVPNPSAEENTTRNSVPCNQNRSKLSEFSSKPFRGREHGSEFLSVQQKIEKLWECCSEPFHGRETKSEQNAAADYFKNSVRQLLMYIQIIL
jgi:hypothetical protein